MKYLLISFFWLSSLGAQEPVMGEKNFNCECVSCFSSPRCANTKLIEDRTVVDKTKIKEKPKVKK